MMEAERQWSGLSCFTLPLAFGYDGWIPSSWMTVFLGTRHVSGPQSLAPNNGEGGRARLNVLTLHSVFFPVLS